MNLVPWPPSPAQQSVLPSGHLADDILSDPREGAFEALAPDTSAKRAAISFVWLPLPERSPEPFVSRFNSPSGATSSMPCSWPGRELLR
ncbi:hypothetical protein [Arthrobacter methylotrophus]|uniref:hypothetical protein n=1 Tax=Arthrobacter methylotrophus TaxID=121291 RepID=UPI0031EABE79